VCRSCSGWVSCKPSIFLAAFCTQLLMARSICLMTLTRILITSYYETDNFTRQNGIVAFITGLEPVAGIINACLPHFPPVFKRLGSTKFATTLSKVFNSTLSKSSRNTDGQKGSSGAYSLSKRSSRKMKVQDSDFERLSDTYGSDVTELTSYAK
jgi:hypothetical protein